MFANIQHVSENTADNNNNNNMTMMMVVVMMIMMMSTVKQGRAKKYVKNERKRIITEIKNSQITVY